MFRKIRKFKQRLSKKETIKIFKSGSYGVLAVSCDSSNHSAVPIGFVYDGGKIFFHCSAKGHKLDAVKKSEKVSFCVAQDMVIPEKFTSLIKSAIAFGRARVIEDEMTKRRVFKMLAEKYFAGIDFAKFSEKIEKSLPRACVIELEIERMTGKASMDIINSRVSSF